MLAKLLAKLLAKFGEVCEVSKRHLAPPAARNFSKFYFTSTKLSTTLSQNFPQPSQEICIRIGCKPIAKTKRNFLNDIFTSQIFTRRSIEYRGQDGGIYRGQRTLFYINKGIESVTIFLKDSPKNLLETDSFDRSIFSDSYTRMLELIIFCLTEENKNESPSEF